jgi:tripartite-type tricarboxylate transporter receptor subunit TctC
LREATVTRLSRRKFLQSAAGTAAASVVPGKARAQSYPSRPVRMVVPYGPGGPSDIVTRLIGQWLSERLGQQFVIENRPGAGGNIGTEMVVRAPADGYTLLQVATPNAVNATLYDKLNYDFIRDIAPVAGICRVTVVMVVHPSVPANTVPEFIAYAKANPGKINMGSAGNGTTAHMAGALFTMMTGVELLHVPYRSQPQALTDLIGGRLQVMLDTTPPYFEHIKAGRLRALAVASANRWEALPELPTLAAFIPGYEVSGWYGIGAPTGTPAEIIARLNGEINAALADAKIVARLADLGGTVLTGSPAALSKFIADETAKWGKVIRFANIKPD